MASRFIALDVETANSGSHSICQIGIAVVDGQTITHTESFLVNPCEDFARSNTELHGIDSATVADAPRFDQVFDMLRPIIEGQMIFQHSKFDEHAMRAACRVYQLDPIEADWRDSVIVARRAWPDFKRNGGHGLGNLKVQLGLKFRHHDAEEDARAAAEVVLMAEAKTGHDLDTLSLPKAILRQREHRHTK